MKSHKHALTRRATFAALALALAVGMLAPAVELQSRQPTDVEYKVVLATHLLAEPEALEHELNRYGDEGWTLIQILDRSALRPELRGEVQDLLILRR